MELLEGQMHGYIFIYVYFVLLLCILTFEGCISVKITQ